MTESQDTTTRTVWKFGVPFPGADQFTVTMPVGAVVMSLHLQYGEPQVWALVDPEAPIEERRFRIAGTGHPISESVRGYVGTFQWANGELVFHVFEVGEAS